MNKIKNIYILYLLFPLINLLTGLMTRFNIFPLTIGVAVRIALLIYILFYVLFISKSKYKKSTLIYYVLLFLFCIVYFITKPNFFTLRVLYHECNFLFKFMYYPILFFGLLNIFDENTYEGNKWKKIMLFNIIFYIIFIIIPIITKTSFNAYVREGIGFSGWFYAANELGPILLMLFPVLFILLEKHKLMYILLSTLAIFSILAISTKVSSLGLGLILIFYFVLYLFKKRKTLNKMILILSIITFALLYSNYGKELYYKLECYNANVIPEKVVPNKKPIININPNNKDEGIDNENNDILSLILSNRNKKVITINKDYKTSSIINKLFGLGFYNLEKDEVFIIEMDFLDLFYHYGIIGLLLALYPYIYMIYQLITSIKNKNLKININLLYSVFIFCLIMGISFVAGHIIGSPAVSSFLVIYAIHICHLINKKLFKEEKEDK